MYFFFFLLSVNQRTGWCGDNGERFSEERCHSAVLFGGDLVLARKSRGKASTERGFCPLAHFLCLIMEGTELDSLHPTLLCIGSPCWAPIYVNPGRPKLPLSRVAIEARGCHAFCPNGLTTADRLNFWGWMLQKLCHLPESAWRFLVASLVLGPLRVGFVQQDPLGFHFCEEVLVDWYPSLDVK